MKVFKFNAAPKEYDIEFKSWVRFMFALNGFRVWAYFNNGNYQIWNVITNKIEKSGTLKNKEEDLFIRNPTLLYERQGHEAIAYVVDEPGRLQVWDIINDTILPGFTQDIPTRLAVPEGERSDKNKTQSILENFELITLPENDIVAILERKPPGQQTNEYCVTFFKKGAAVHPNTRVDTGDHKQMWLNRLNKKDRLILWGPSYNNAAFHFWLLTYVEGQANLASKEIKLKEAMNAEVVNVFPWVTNKFIFLYNRNDSGKPRYAIVDLADPNAGTIPEQHYTIEYEPSRESNLTETYYCNGYRETIIFEEMTENGINTNCIIHNADHTKIQLSSRFVNDENLKVEPHSFGVSPDGRFLAEYSENFDINDPMDDELKKWKLKFNAVSIRGVRLLTYYLLHRSKLTETYSLAVVKDIIDMLSTEEKDNKD